MSTVAKHTKKIIDAWQQRPLLLKNFCDVDNPLSADELAGLALDGVNARIVSGNYEKRNWKLLQQPFSEDVFAHLPQKDWTLLVQGVDRFIPEIYHLIDKLNCIPRWKFDDVMMSYAATGGSVGPHFDYYDVFLVQTSGTRKWQLSTKHCTEDNYNTGFDLKVMQHFEAEIEYITNPGDVLYIPPKVAHFGTSLDDDCTTLSFGYRAYSAGELATFCDKQPKTNGYYQDPIWALDTAQNPALIRDDAVKNAQKLVDINAVEFAEFVTKTDLADEEILQDFFDVDEVFQTQYKYILSPSIKIAYTQDLKVYIAGSEFAYGKENEKVMIEFCNTREILGTHILAKQLFDRGFLQTKVVE